MKDDPHTTNAILHTVIIFTARMKEMAAFYGQGLELGEAAPTGSDHLGFPLPNAYLGFDLVENAPEPTGAVTLWFEVDDLETTFQKFVELGAGVGYPPTRKPWGGYLASLRDLDGNVFGLSARVGDAS